MCACVRVYVCVLQSVGKTHSLGKDRGQIIKSLVCYTKELELCAESCDTEL